MYSFHLAGVNKLSSHLKEMTGKRPNIAFQFCWMVLSPCLIVVSFTDIMQYWDSKSKWWGVLPLHTSDVSLPVPQKCFVVAGHLGFSNHSVQTSPLWEHRIPTMGSGDRLGSCCGFHHLDSSVCHSHVVGSSWFPHTGDTLHQTQLSREEHCSFSSCQYFLSLSISQNSSVFPSILMGFFCSLQKLKLSVTPYALDKIKKSAFDETIKDLGQPEISVINFNNEPKKAFAESKF